MLNRLRTFSAIALGLALALAGCDSRDRTPRLAHALGTDPSVVATTAGRAAGRATAGAASVPDEIYYDLTMFEWYARAEPLIFNGRMYQPDDKPLAIPGADLAPAGSFRGVDFYVQRSDPPPYAVVFVPVFDGYWQSFVTEAREPLPAQ